MHQQRQSCWGTNPVMAHLTMHCLSCTRLLAHQAVSGQQHQGCEGSRSNLQHSMERIHGAHDGPPGIWVDQDHDPQMTTRLPTLHFGPFLDEQSSLLSDFYPAFVTASW